MAITVSHTAGATTNGSVIFGFMEFRLASFWIIFLLSGGAVVSLGLMDRLDNFGFGDGEGS